MTEEHNHEEDFDDELDFEDYGDGIFTDEESVETLRKSAEALGINPDLVAPKSDEDSPQYRYYAKGGCKHCFGRGVLNVVLSPSKPKVHWRVEGLPGRITKQKIKSAKKRKRRAAKKYEEPVVRSPQPTQKARKLISGLSPGNELGEQWDTREERPKRKPSKVLERLGFGKEYSPGTQQPEPPNYKSDNLSQSFCKCVRAIEV